MKEKHRRVFFTLMLALVFHGAGAYFVEAFVNYPTWRFIGAEEFRAYHNALGERFIPLMVVPWFVEIALTFLLMRFRPRAVPLGAVALAQAFNLVSLASTIFIQIPIQLQFGSHGMSAEALDRLIATDPIRWVAFILKLAVYLWMGLRIAAAGGDDRGEESVGDRYGSEEYV